MCDPMSLAGMAMSTAGSFAKARSQQQFVDETNAQNKLAYDRSQDARQSERIRQRQFDQQNNQTFADTLKGLSVESAAKDRGKHEASFTELMSGTPSEVTASTRLPGQDGASVAVQQNITSRVQDQEGKTNDRVAALAKLGAYGGAGADRGASLGAAGDRMSTVGGLRRGSLTVAGQEQAIPAAQVTPGSTIFADILSGIGGLASYGGAGMMGKLFPGAASTGVGLRPQPNPFF